MNYQGQLSASWELDFWGKYRNNYTMLSDVLLNTVVSHEALRLSVASQTAQSYFALLALDMQLATAKRTLRTREDAFGIYTSRYRQGDITELDWDTDSIRKELQRNSKVSAEEDFEQIVKKIEQKCWALLSKNGLITEQGIMEYEKD